MITSIYIGQDKLDLFEEDNIVIDSSVSKIEDITKVFTDTSNSFSVPATDNNNKILKHFYTTNLVDGWDVFSKVNCVVELNGLFYKQLKLKLNSATVKSNKPVSYSLQMFGLLADLKDILGSDKLTDLDFSSYDFNYTGNNVWNSLINGSLSDVRFSTLSTKRLIYSSDSSVDNTDTIKNIAQGDTDLNSGLPFEALMPSILNIRIIEAIESKYGLTFSRDFFSQNQFNNLYLMLNGNKTVNRFEEQIVFDVATSDPTLYNNRVLLSDQLPYDNTYQLKISVDCDNLNQREKFKSVIKANGVEIHSIEGSGNEIGIFSYIVKRSEIQTNFENLTFHFSSEFPLEYKYTVDRDTSIDINSTFYKSEKDTEALSGVFNVTESMPDLKVIDYLSGLFKCFKLVCINTSETDIYIDSLEKYYRNGKVKDITKFVDFKEIPISTGKILNQINYKFKEPSTILQKQFFENNNIHYGDLEYKLTDENGKLVEGETVDVKLPFENMIYEKLQDLNGVNDVNFMYGYMANESLEPVNVKAHLHYIENISPIEPIKVLTGSIGYLLATRVNVPTHTLGVSTPQYSTVFGEEFNEYNGVLISNTIYSNFHKSYVENVFYKNRRIKKIQCKNLPTEFLINLKLNDVIEIKDEYYRINNYKVNLITKECLFELYNVDNLDLTPLTSITTDSTIYTTDSTTIKADNNS